MERVLITIFNGRTASKSLRGTIIIGMPGPGKMNFPSVSPAVICYGSMASSELENIQIVRHEA